MSALEVVTDILDLHDARRPDAPAIVFLRNGEEVGESLTYRELRSRARAVAAQLCAALPAGARAVLLYPPGPDFIVALLGALYARVIAVPLAPPRRGGERLQAVIANCGASALLGPAATLRRAQSLLEPNHGLISFAAEATPAPGADDVRPGAGAANDVALLQYTSGSTGAPKGVMLTHANILSNQAYIARCYGHGEGFTCVSWLPMYHDMGLMAGVLQPLYRGGTAVLMSPFSFLQKPARWLKAISDYRAYSSGAPNFAYDLCVERIAADQGDFDLSAWEIACVGAEPVRAATLDRFADRFAAQGFRRSAICPSYGLAEATLLVTGVDQRRPPTVLESSPGTDGDAFGGRLVSSGRLASGADVLILDPESEVERPEGREGEICVAGPGVSPGYWGRASAPPFRLPGSAGATDYLRTRDLGFIQDGELFVTGRLDDMMIVQGRNYHANDLELAVESLHAAISPHGCASFSVEVGADTLVVMVMEVSPRIDWAAVPWNELFATIRERLAQRHELPLSGALVVREGEIPITTSGKIRRSKCREMFKASEFEPVAQWRSQALQRAYPGATPGQGDEPATPISILAPTPAE